MRRPAIQYRTLSPDLARSSRIATSFKESRNNEVWPILGNVSQIDITIARVVRPFVRLNLPTALIASPQQDNAFSSPGLKWYVFAKSKDYAYTLQGQDETGHLGKGFLPLCNVLEQTGPPLETIPRQICRRERYSFCSRRSTFGTKVTFGRGRVVKLSQRVCQRGRR